MAIGVPTMKTAGGTDPQVSPWPMVMALLGTLFLRAGGGVMGILIGLFLAAKDNEMLQGSSGGAAPNPNFTVSATLIGIITASYFITELGGSFISGRLIDRDGPRRFMIFGPLFGAGAVFITAALHLRSDSVPFQFILFLGLLFATRLLEGAAGAVTNPATLAYIAAYTDKSPKLRSRVSGYFEIATLVGAGVGFVVGGTLWDKFGQNAFLLNFALYLFSALIFFFGLRNITRNAAADGGHAELGATHSFGAYMKLLTAPKLRELVPAWLAISALLGVLFNLAAFQLSDGSSRSGAASEAAVKQIVRFPDQTLSHAFSGQSVGLVFGLYALAFGVGIVVWTLRIPKMRKSTVMLISSVGVMFASVLLAAINHTGALGDSNLIRIPLILLMLIAVGVESGFTPAALVYLSDISESYAENRGMVMGLYSFLLGFGQVLGSVIGGPFADRAAIDGLLLFMSILALISMFGIFFLRRDELLTHSELTPGPSDIPLAESLSGD